MSPRDVQRINISSGKAIADLLRPTLGPYGRDKMLVDSDGMVVVTNDGMTILGEMDVELDVVPAGRLLFKLAQAQDDSIGDGTTTAVVLAGELLAKAEELLSQGVHPTVISSGYRMAAGKALEHLEACAIPVRSDDTTLLEAVAQISMAGKGTERASGALSPLIVEAVRTIEDGNEIDLDDVSLVKATGGTISDSLLLQGLIVDTSPPVLSNMPEYIENARIACISTHLNPLESQKGELTVRDPAELGTVLDYEGRASKKIVDDLVKHGVNVVFCEKDIGHKVQQHLANNSILAINRTTPDDIRKIARATGARIVTNVGEIAADDIGGAGLVERRFIGVDKLLVIEDCENPKSISLLLRGGTEHVLDEVERSIADSLGVVRQAHQDARVLPGGGASDVGVSLALRTFADGVSGREQLAIRAFADAVGVIPRSLAENVGRHPIDSLVELRAKQSNGESTAGFAERDIVDDVVTAGIVEPLTVKTHCLVGATDAVASILCIDGILDAEDLNPTGAEAKT